MTNRESYSPINCSYYDVLESFATMGTLVNIEIDQGDGSRIIVEDQIIDFKTHEGEEFIILKSGQTFRLDLIKSVNGISTENYPFKKQC